MKDVAAPVSPVREFWHGATRPSPTAFFVATATVIVGLGLLALRLTPGWYSQTGYGYFMTNGSSYDAYVSAKAMGLSMANPDERTVVLIGGSITRAATPSEEVFSQLLADAGVENARVYKLCVGALSSWQMAALAGQVPDSLNGVVVIGMGVNRLSRSHQELQNLLDKPRLGFISPVILEEARLAGLERPAQTGIYLLDNRKFFIPRLKRFAYRLIAGPVRETAPMYPVNAKQSEREWAENAKRLRRIREDYDRYAKLNFAVTQRMLDSLRQRGIKVVFLDPPINPRFLTEEINGDDYQTQRNDIVNFLAPMDVTVIDLHEEVVLTPSDFYDWAHINNPKARKRFSVALANEIGSIMHKPEPEPTQ